MYMRVAQREAHQRVFVCLVFEILQLLDDRVPWGADLGRHDASFWWFCEPLERK